MTFRFRMATLACACLLLYSPGNAQTLVGISDTLYNADGTTASGRIVVSWNPFTAPDGTTVDGGTLTYTIPAAGGGAGVVTLSLYPNAGASPAGTSYTARYFLANGAQYTETWVVPASGPATISDVRVLNAPAPGAAIPVSMLTGGPLEVALGGTGLDALGGANLCLKVNSVGTALEYGSCAAGGTGITSLNGETGPSQSFAAGTAGTDFGISSGSDVHTFNLPSASASNRGALTSADWTAFDSKQPALSTSGPVANQFVTGFTAPDNFTRAQPAFANLAGTAADAQIPDTITINLAASASALAANGANCSGNNFALGVDAAGNAECAQPAFSNLSGAAAAGQLPNLEALNGTLDVASGGTGAAPGSGDQVLVSDSTAAATWRAIPDCNTENMLTYNAATNTFGCEADDGGGGGMTSFNIDGDNNSPQTITNGNEALFVGGVGIDTTAAAVDQITFDLDLAELVNNQTLWDSSNASRTLTAGLSGAADPVITFSDNTVNVSTGTLQQGGTPVVLESRTVSTSGAALTGGGDLSANRIITLSASPNSASVVGTGRTLTGGAGIAALGDLSADRTIQTASGETDFLASGALACGAGTRGRMQVHTTPLQYCDNAATPALQYAAYGNSSGESTAAANGSVALGSDVSGQLPSANGGTGANNTATTGRYLRGNGTNFVTSSGAASGTGGCTNQFVRTLNDDAAPACASVGSADITDGVVSSADLATANKTVTKTVSIFDPTTADTNKIQFYWPAAVTLQRVACATDSGTVTIQLDERAEGTPNTAGTNSLTSTLVCDTNSETTTSFADSGIAIDVPHNLQITAVSGTPAIVRIHVKAQIN